MYTGQPGEVMASLRMEKVAVARDHPRPHVPLSGNLRDPPEPLPDFPESGNLREVNLPDFPEMTSGKSTPL